MGVSTTKPIYNKFLSRTSTNRVILGGTDSIRENAQTYIPKPSALDQKEYEAMINRPSFDNVALRVLDTFLGLTFSKHPQIEVPTKTLEQLKEIDLSDNTDIDFSKKAMKELIISGRCGVLVDIKNSNINEPVNAMIYDTLGIRPYLAFYPSESIINWREENNKLILVVLIESVEEWISKFDTQTVTQYRVLEIDETGYYKQSIYKTDKDNQDLLVSETYPTQNGQKMRYIPFYPANALNLEIEPETPPLSEICDANLSMHKLKIDLYHGMYHLIPSIWGAGIDEDQSPTIVLGGSSINIFRNPQAKLEFLEFKGDGLSHLTGEIENCKTTMSKLGAEFLRDNKNVGESFEAMQLQNTSDRATLKSIANIVSRLMVKCIEEMARWNGDKGQITYILNSEYDVKNVDSQFIKVIMDGVTMGQIPQQVLFHNLQTAEAIPENIEDYETFQGMLDTQSIDLGVPTTTQTNANVDTSFINSLRQKLGL